VLTAVTGPNTMPDECCGHGMAQKVAAEDGFLGMTSRCNFF